MDFKKERGVLTYTLDRFFNTIEGGWRKKLVTIGNDPVTTVEVADRDSPNVFAELGKLGVIICGGAITSTFSAQPVKDIDLYVKDSANLVMVEDMLRAFFPIEHSRSINAITLQRKSEGSRKLWTAQLITKFSGPPSTIFNWFDFTVTHGAYDFATRDFVLGERFLQDLAKRRLVYAGYSKYPICALYRVKKYLERGYTVPGATLMHIALSIVQLRIENYGQLKEQLMGIDTMYLQKLLDKYNPENPVDYGEFIEEAFKLIDNITGLTEAETDDEE